mmetsp:Transcript_131351/g.366198  ORF Transcript_131351/g.366198 Transcript_131351/m.366198 type:complete len:200 (+) Transcript_131351:1792-2391(+)
MCASVMPSSSQKPRTCSGPGVYAAFAPTAARRWSCLTALHSGMMCGSSSWLMTVRVRRASTTGLLPMRRAAQGLKVHCLRSPRATKAMAAARTKTSGPKLKRNRRQRLRVVVKKVISKRHSPTRNCRLMAPRLMPEASCLPKPMQLERQRQPVPRVCHRRAVHAVLRPPKRSCLSMFAKRMLNPVITTSYSTQHLGPER